MEKISICLDVGGTYIKGMVFDQDKMELLDKIFYYPSRSQESKEIIITHFIYIITNLIRFISLKPFQVGYIGFAFPGPFDYENGISYIKGLEKYKALYEVDLKQSILAQLGESSENEFKDTELYFINDAIAFAFGEKDISSAETGAYFTLGTGFGSTFLAGHQMVRNALNIPASGMIYNEAFKDSIIDDYLSDRGLRCIAKERCGSSLDGKQLYELAIDGNEKARCVFKLFGRIIGEALKQYIEQVKPEEVVFGGQISKAFPFFKDEISIRWTHQALIRASTDTSKSILKGIIICKEKEITYSHTE